MPSATSSSARPTLVILLTLLGLVGFAGCGTDSGQEVGKGRPNIVMLVADDLGRSFVGSYGGARVATPNLDRLAAEGMQFRNAFTPTGLCRPSRWAIYTGQYPHVSGVEGFNRVPQDPVLLHDVLGRAGYRTGLIAKFGSKVPEASAFDVFVPRPESNDGYDVEAVAAGVRTFLAGTGGSPFFLLVGFGDPHAPYPDRPHCDPDEVLVPGYLPDLPAIRESLAHYYAAVHRLDRGVGLVLDELAAAGVDRETIVVFTSDHGPAFPFAKSTLYDASVAVPMIVRWPARTGAGEATDRLVSFVDLRPTLLEAAGVGDPQADVDGTSFLAALESRPDPGPEAVFLSHTANWEGQYPMRAVRTRRFKYIRNFAPDTEFEARLEMQPAWQAMLAAAEGDPAVAARVALHKRRPPAELYDLELDPDELVNRIDDPALADELERLRALLDQTMRSAADPLLGP